MVDRKGRAERRNVEWRKPSGEKNTSRGRASLSLPPSRVGGNYSVSKERNADKDTVVTEKSEMMGKRAMVMMKTK